MMRYKWIQFVVLVSLIVLATPLEAKVDNHAYEIEMHYGQGLFNSCNSIFFGHEKNHVITREQKGFERVVIWMKLNLRPSLNRPPIVLHNEVSPYRLLLYCSTKVPSDAATTADDDADLLLFCCWPLRTLTEKQNTELLKLIEECEKN